MERRSIAEYSRSLRSHLEIPPPIPLLINPADVKKEFDKNKPQIVTPRPFQKDADDNREDSLKNDEFVSKKGSQKSTSEGENGHSKKSKNKKGKSSLRSTGSSESFNSSTTNKSDKNKGKKRKLESLEKKNQMFNLKFNKTGSKEEGREMFSWIIEPVSLEDFFSATWEKRPLHICREMPMYYCALLSTAKFDQMLRDNDVQFTKNLDITSYRNGIRETLNPEGRALPATVWDFYKQGCSVRLLNPQTFNSRIWALNSMLQEYFGCFVGANIYLTPPGTQGFAPHYDDIEAFVLQLEGKKHWRLYSPRSAEEELPRFSSGNLQENDIGTAIMDVVLEAGDLLYFPRGTIHQANALPDSHSLHITISCYQKNTWGDFLQKLLPAALEAAMEEDVEFRKGLPRDYLDHLGVAHCDQNTQQRSFILAKLRTLTDKLFRYAPVDAAADQLGKQLMHDALPPKLDQGELLCSAFENGPKMVEGVVKESTPLGLRTKIRLLRGNILRLVSEDDGVTRIYHSLENSREFHAEEPRSFDVQAEDAVAVEELLHAYPQFKEVGNLPLDSDREKLQLATSLWKRGLLLTEKPL